MQEKTLEIARSTMLGDLMHTMLDIVKPMQKPWQQMSQDEQDWWLESLEKQCTSAIEQCVTLLASDGHVAMPATLKRVVFKGAVEATLVIEKQAQNRIDLADAAGTTVQLVIWDTESHMGDGNKPKAEANQRPLDLDGDDAESERTDDDDAYLQLAIEFVRTTRKCTISAIQRNFAIGYNRAARLVEKLEALNVLSPMNEEGKRVVLTAQPKEAASDEKTE